MLLLLTVMPGLSQTTSPATGSTDTAAFSENAAHTLLQQVRDGLVAHNERKMLSAFDAEQMTDYPTFRRQIDALFDTYDSFRVHFTIEQSSGDNERGTATVDFEIEESPASSGGQPVRKQEELRFSFEHAKTGWKILDVDPRSFFS
ncbi:MAG TPA: hypothetical protein VFQ00_07160 [Terriglobales bacterium]|nr:hypothetical protein [Terriglobales bacterium]